MRNASRPDLKRLAHKLVLRINFTVVVPLRRIRPAGCDRRVVTDLLRKVSVSSSKVDVFEGFSLLKGKCPFETVPDITRTSIGLNGLAIRPIVLE